MTNSLTENILLYGFFSIFLVLFFWSLIGYRETLFKQTTLDDYSVLYSTSQYVLGDQKLLEISDSDLYSYAAYIYLQGQDPTTVNFEHPPLAKYLYGFGAQLFGSVYTINSVVYGVLALCMYAFSAMVLQRTSMRFLSMAIFFSFPIVSEQLQFTMLDIPLLISVLLLFILLASKKCSPVMKYGLVGVCLGVMSAIKYPFPFMILPAGLVMVVAHKEKVLLHALYSFVVAVGVYLATYSVYFMSHSLVDFARFEWFRFSWWTGERTIPKFLIFDSILFGKYAAWWQPHTIYTEPSWSRAVPLTFLGYCYACLRQRHSFWSMMMGMFSVLTLFLFAFGSASSLRYILLLLPFWIVLIVRLLEQKLSGDTIVQKVSP
ncbi:MAG: hypothetical protein H6774_03865 [Pseudomonadales bacterium]|nr:hypothetical protein [Pseudomonadales bacterium]